MDAPPCSRNHSASREPAELPRAGLVSAPPRETASQMRRAANTAPTTARTGDGDGRAISTSALAGPSRSAVYPLRAVEVLLGRAQQCAPPMQGLLRARSHCTHGVLEQSWRDFRIVEDGVSPAIEFDAFGEHLGAHATPVARDRVEDQFELPSAHARLTSLLAGVRPGTGSTRAACVWGHGRGAGAR